MSWLFEDPTYVLILGGLTVVILLVALFRTGRGVFIGAIAGVLALVGVLVLVERLVVTDREKVEDTLHGAAAALQENNVNKVLDYISPSSKVTRDEVREIMKGLQVKEAKITSDIELTFNQLTNPPSATATFVGRIDADFGGVKVPPIARLRVTLRKEGDRWLTSDYELLDDLQDRGGKR